MNVRLLTVCAVLMLAACGQAGPLYLPGNAPPPRASGLDRPSSEIEPAAITVPPPKPAVAGSTPDGAENVPEARKDDSEPDNATPTPGSGGAIPEAGTP
jgi:predicted small lipoprotein YifL